MTRRRQLQYINLYIHVISSSLGSKGGESIQPKALSKNAAVQYAHQKQFLMHLLQSTHSF